MSQAKVEHDARTSSSGKDIDRIYNNTYGFAKK